MEKQNIRHCCQEGPRHGPQALPVQEGGRRPRAPTRGLVTGTLGATHLPCSMYSVVSLEDGGTDLGR